MNRSYAAVRVLIITAIFVVTLVVIDAARGSHRQREKMTIGPVTIHHAVDFDVSPPLASLSAARNPGSEAQPADCGHTTGCGLSPDSSDRDFQEQDRQLPPTPSITAAGAAVEQISQGVRPAIPSVDSFDGLGAGFKGPQSGQGPAFFRNPSDNSLAVGPNHIVQIVNSRFAVYTKKGARFDNSGTVLYGPVATNEIFAGFGGVCQERDNGDAVVRYDQLANRWLVVMPIFTPIPTSAGGKRGTAHEDPAKPGHASIPGAAGAPPTNPAWPEGPYAMCYAVSTTSDPLGTYYRYAFERDLFPDYPRPAVWPDGYYVPTSTGDTVIQKHVCIADRERMLKGLPSTEQCLVIDGVNFLNNSDVDGAQLPPPGAPNIMMAAGGTQLKKIFEDNGIYFWKVHVDWRNPRNTKAVGPVKIAVAPYHYLCDGQLSSCVPQPGTDQRLDSQGDKIMQRLVYRKIGDHESIVAAHSIATKAGAGGIRWYEFRLNENRDPVLYQQGTYAPDGLYRWMPSIDMDKNGDIGVGYSFGGTPNFPGQRFAARLASDPPGQLTFHESILAEGQASQTNTLRWEDYVTTAIDPSDDCTFWYVGDYIKTGSPAYSTR
ncbi:MAG TPA: hypothetical protein VKB26_10840, partial [Candidatus Acidoferrales bacterium]|nr:hypothetical protein [Candidatus Acidoferrales bacterium]